MHGGLNVNSRLMMIVSQSQSYHVAGFDMDECLARVLGFFGTCARMMEFSFSVNYWALFIYFLFCFFG